MFIYDLIKALVRKEDSDANWTQLFFGGNDSDPPTTHEQSRSGDPEMSINSMDSKLEVPDQVSSLNNALA